MTDLMNILVLWLSVNFGLAHPQLHPQVRYIPAKQIEAIHHYGRVGLDGKGGVVAVYHDRLHIIFLRDDWRSQDVSDVSVLVHELVHHLQNVAGMKYACPAEREALAYQAQERWLRMFGEDLQRAFDIDAMTLKLRTSCMHTP